MTGLDSIARALAALLAIASLPVMAQQSAIPRIGFLSINSESAMAARVEALRYGLRELGYVEGKSIQIEFRYAAGVADHLGPLSVELLAQKVEVIVTEGPSATRAARQATTIVPIVMGRTLIRSPLALWPGFPNPAATSMGWTACAP